MDLKEVIEKYKSGEMSSADVAEWARITPLTADEKRFLFRDYGCINRFAFGKDTELEYPCIVAQIIHNQYEKINLHHKLTIKRPYNCYNIYECPACGLKWEVDSSD